MSNVLLAVLLMFATIWPNAIEPRLRIDGITTLQEVSRFAPRNRFTYTIAVFSSQLKPTPVTVTVRLDTARLTVIGSKGDTGAWSDLTWRGTVSASRPATISLGLLVRPTALAGDVQLYSTAVDALGAVAASGDVVRVCCNTKRLMYFPAFYG
jgi:hypothetical protein